MGSSKLRGITSIVAIVLGALMIIGGIATWAVASSTLSNQRITVSEDGCLGGSQVRGPFTAYCQALIIQEHTLEMTDGLTYAELDREDPRREVAMNSSFLQASLFTSVLAFGVAAMAVGMGLLFVLIGLGIRDVSQQARAPAAA